MDESPAQVDFVARFGSKTYYGDASRLDILGAAQIEKARAFVLAIDDVEASLRTAKVVRRHFPDVPILARARKYTEELEGLFNRDLADISDTPTEPNR